MIEVRRLAEGEKKLQPTSVEYRHAPARQAISRPPKRRIEDFLAKRLSGIQRSGRKQPIDARADIEVLEITDGQLRIVQRITRTAAVSPREILDILNLGELEQAGCWLTRTSIDCETADRATASP